MSSHEETAAYGRIKDVFLELHDLDAGERAARIDALALESPELAEALRKQFAASARKLPFLDRADAGHETPSLPHYRIVGELGRGGMGVVWLAERRLDDARQQVALKQIAHSGWTDEDLRRFQRERRILAGLTHPNVAALVDGGTDPSGAPFLATQFIDGERLDRYCEAHALKARARVALMRQVVSAVAYAHSRLVVHRDLKPANVLVTKDGVAKLLDFGIARALHEEAVTTTGPSQMTLRYAAPEQVASEGSEAGVGVDVYALGVLLYELVAKQSPYGDADGTAALIHAILNDDPAPPSRARGALADADRDLDAICLKALRKRAQDRYESAADFLADLDRWLAREPVAARRDERGYYARAFVRRRWPALAAGFVLLALGFGFLGYHLDATRQRLEEVSAERDKARAVAHLIEAFFESASPNEISSGELTARELLHRSVARIKQGASAEMTDDARASMNAAAADILASQNLLPESAELFENALALWKKLPSPPYIDVATTYNNLANVEYQRGNTKRALELQREVLKTFESAGETETSSYGSGLQMLAFYQSMTGDTEGGQTTLERSAEVLAIAVEREQTSTARGYYATALGNVGVRALYKGDAQRAYDLMQKALVNVRLQTPRNFKREIGIERSIAAALRELGRYEEADAAYRDLILRAREFYGGHDQEIGLLLHSQAQMFMLQKRWDDARVALEESEAMHAKDGGTDHPRALLARSDRARIWLEQGRYADAERETAAVLERRAAAPSNDPIVLASEQVAREYAACRAAAAPTAAHADALRDAYAAMERNPPLPRARLAQAAGWVEDCTNRATSEHP